MIKALSVLDPADKPNAVIAKGQTINLPAGGVNRLYILAASSAGDEKAAFQVGGRTFDLTIQDWGGYVGQWDNRKWKKVEMPLTAEELARQEARAKQQAQAAAARGEKLPAAKLPTTRMVEQYDGLGPGFVKPAPAAWFASHRHSAAGGNEPYAFSYLFVYEVEIPSGTTTLTLPMNDKVRILAVTAAVSGPSARPAQALVDRPAR